MSRYTPTIPLSQIIASDAPLLSPISAADSPWDQHPVYSPTCTDSFAFNYYNLPPSPPNSTGSTSAGSPRPTSRMLRMRMSPDSGSESEQQLCLPTHQVFDLPEVSHPPSQHSPSSSKQPLSISINSTYPVSTKRSASPAPSVTKKPRATGERICSKDFIPPDVSGLSKREARLVKNRAAAFLSRQRKREEFECMEVRVAELEQENARLLALAENGRGNGTRPQDGGNAEIERLRAQLAAAEERERELSAELERKATSNSRDVSVKVEVNDPRCPPPSPIRCTPIQSPHKSGASLGLMVLLCALPTLLSMPTKSALHTTFSLPITGASTFSTSSSAFDFNTLIPNDWDWSRNPSNSAMMDLDVDDHGQITSTISSTTSGRRLEFVDGAPAGLGDLDISFDASPSDDGKILVRIHPSSSSSPSDSPSPATSSKEVLSSSLAMWAPGFGMSSARSSMHSVPSPFDFHTSSDPFLGAGSTSEFAPLYPSDVSSSSSLYGRVGESSSADFGFGFGLEGDSSAKRRVRIALKSMPALGGEGGEWEVQVC